MGTRTTYISQLSSPRPGWREGREAAAGSWFFETSLSRGLRPLEASHIPASITFARGMFCGEVAIPGGRRVLNVGERPTLLAAQLAVEAALERLAAQAALPTSSVAQAPARPVLGETPAARLRVLPGERLARLAPANVG